MHCPPPHWGNVAALSGSGTDSDALLWKAAVVAAGGTVSDARLSLVSAFLGNLKSSLIYPAFDRLIPLAGENTQSQLIDFVTRSTATAVNSPTFTTQGVAGNGSTSYVNTNYTPSTSALALSQNSAHLSFYTNTTSVQSQQAGSGVGNPSLHVLGPHVDGKMYARITDAGGAAGQGTGLTTGHFIGDRTGSNTILNYLNGASVGTVTDASAGLPPWPVIIGGLNSGGTPSSQGTGRFAFFSVGGSLGAAGDVAFSSALLTFLTAIGAN